MSEGTFDSVQTGRPNSTKDVSVLTLWEGQRLANPQGTAISFEGNNFSYSRIDELSDALSDELIRGGVAIGDTLGVCANRSPYSVIALLAIMKIGCAYLPLDLGQPSQRIKRMIAISQPSIVFVDPDAQMPEEDMLPLAIPGGAYPLSRVRHSPTRLTNLPAYVMFTSGSTGLPVGVVVPHKALINRILWGQTSYPLDSSDCVLASSNIGFDYSIWEMLAPLCFGARSLILPPGWEANVDLMVRVLRESRPTVAHFIPSVLRLLLEHSGVRDAMSSLRYVMCGGEALSGDLQRRFFAVCSGRLFNQYGPTEACIDVTWRECKKADEHDLVPIGRVIDNSATIVLDEKRQLVPVGGVGELFLAGHCLASGYVGDPSLTALRFIPNEWSPEMGSRLFATGDMVRSTEEGELVFLGRRDEQMKIRGVRVEPAELMLAASEHPDVLETWALPLAEEQRVSLFYRCKSPLDPGDLLEFLRARIPEPLLPSRPIPVESFPLLGSGKLDRETLSDIAIAARTSQAQMREPPNTALEVELLELWKGVLDLDEIGVQEDFFALGGHSLLVPKLITEVRKTFGIRVPLRALFQHPTIRQLASYLDNLKLSLPRGTG